MLHRLKLLLLQLVIMGENTVPSFCFVKFNSLIPDVLWAGHDKCICILLLVCISGTYTGYTPLES